MKVYVEYNIIDGPDGGGNQFIKCLSNTLNEEYGILTHEPSEADIILYNGHQNHEKLLYLREQFSDKIFVHRLDGLQKLYNKPDDPRQDLAMEMNDVAHGTIFQSEWAMNKFEEFGFNCDDKKCIVIHNAVDDTIFSPNYRKIKLVTTSWSENWKKGFEVYQYLDRQLNFDEYDYTFIGNSPVEFDNIHMMGRLNSKEIAEYLKNSDIFISASQHDACSNSILEALSCGLPVIALSDGGNTELEKYGITLFMKEEEILYQLEHLKKSIFPYNIKIKTKNIKKIAHEYIEFFYTLL